MNPHLRTLVALLAERAVDDYLREREADKQDKPNGLNSEEARVRLEQRKNNEAER
jgi:hypothetical protein